MFIILFITLFALSWAGETDFIVGGKDVDFAGKYPWQASLTNNYGGHFCGGAIIDEYWIVTAAHCVQSQSANRMKVIVGRHQLRSNAGKPVTHNVKRIVKNTGFPGNNMFMTNDVALVQLSSPISFNSYAQKIAMASGSEDYLGQMCVLSGWGRYDRSTNAPANTLQELATKVVSRSQCEYGFRSYGWKIQDSHICFQQAGATACHGDSGGPAVCKVYGKWILVGVTSGGSPYCHLGYPNIYTRISSWRSWINQYSGL